MVAEVYGKELVSLLDNRYEYQDLYGRIQESRAIQEWFVAITLLGFLRAGRFLNLSDEIHMVWYEMKKSCNQVLKLTVLVVPLMIAIVCTAYLSFGSQQEEFSTFTKSFVSVMRFLSLDDQVSDLYHDLSVHASQTTPFFFLVSLFLYFFLLLSLLQAIIFSSWNLTRRLMQHRNNDRIKNLLKPQANIIRWIWDWMKLLQAELRNVITGGSKSRSAFYEVYYKACLHIMGQKGKKIMKNFVHGKNWWLVLLR